LRYGKLKKDYDVLIQMKNNSGFGWDEKAELPTAPEAVWERYLKVGMWTFFFFFLNHMIIVLRYKILHAAYAIA